MLKAHTLWEFGASGGNVQQHDMAAQREVCATASISNFTVIPPNALTRATSRQVQ